MQQLSIFRTFLPFAVCLMLTGCHKAPPPAEPEIEVKNQIVSFPDKSPQLAVFRSARAQSATTETLTLPGRLILDETRTARIFTPFAGRIEAVLADWGQTVKAGQPLARLSAPDLGQAQADLSKTQVDARVAQLALERAKALFQDGVIAQKDLELAQADFERSRAELLRNQAKSRAYHSGSKVDQNGVVFAPIAGRVVERNATVGTEVRPDNNQPGAPALFVISDLGELEAIFDLPESELAQVRVGQTLAVSSAAYPDKTYAATVQVIQDQIDPDSRSVKLRARIDNHDQLLKAGQFVNAVLTTAGHGGAIVPSSAVLLVDQQAVVFVDRGRGQFERRKVSAAPAGFNRMRITAGLQNDEAVVHEGALFLQQIYAQGRK